VDTGSGPWLHGALEALRDCEPRVVVIGAAADTVRQLVPDGVLALDNPDHERGMGSSLQVGLRALMPRASVHRPVGAPRAAANSDHHPAPGIDAAVVMLVDLPGVGPEVIRRVSAAAGDDAAARGALVRAAYDGVPGHPVLLGNQHWAGVIAAAGGDVGARDYLAAHAPVLVECADIGSGLDVDRPGQLSP